MDHTQYIEEIQAHDQGENQKHQKEDKVYVKYFICRFSMNLLVLISQRAQLHIITVHIEDGLLSNIKLELVKEHVCRVGSKEH